MKRTMIAAALFGVAFSGEAAQAQDWGGAAGVAAMRGYTASPGVRMTSYDGGLAPTVAQIPAGGEAQPSIGNGTSTAAADTVASGPRLRRRAAGRAAHARVRRPGHHRHRPTA